MTNWVHMTQFKVSSSDQVDYRSSHTEVHANSHPKIFGWLRQADCRISNNKSQKEVHSLKSLVQMISASASCHLVSVCCGSSTTKVMDSLLHGLNNFINLLGRGRFLQLSVISKRMVQDTVAVYSIRDRCSTHNKKNRSQGRSLWDPTADEHCGRATVVYS